MRRVGPILFLGVALAVADCGGSSAPVCSLSGGQPLATSAWPKFRADLANTGQSTADLSGFAPSGDLIRLWRYETGGAVSSSPAIGPAGEIYIGSADTRAYRLDGTTGNVIWQAVTSNTITSGPAIDAGGNVYVTSNDGNLYSLAAATGGSTHATFTVTGVLSSPSVANGPNAGVVYVGSLMTGLFAVCPNAILRWASQSVPVATTPAVDSNGNVYLVASNTGRIVSSLNPTNGQQNWIFTATAPINASAVIAGDGTIYVIDSLGRLFGINPQTGTSPGVLFDLTKVNPAAQVLASPALGADGTLYIADTTGSLWAVDTPSGELKWPEPAMVGGGIYSSPLVTVPRMPGDPTIIIFGADDGVVYAVTDLGDSAAVRWTYDTTKDPFPAAPLRSSPALAQDGTIYIGSNNHGVYAFRPPQ